MEIVFALSEMVPFAKTGGLADVGGALPHEIAKLGPSVSVFLPKYKSVSEHLFPLQTALESLEIPLGSDTETGRVLRYRLGNIDVFFIDQPMLFQRDQLYGTPMGDFPDNDRRFVFFQRGMLEALKRLKLKPDIIHCHDWQTGLIPVYLKTLYRRDPFFSQTRTVFTIHNLAYQGNFPPDSLSVTGLSWRELKPDRLEFFGKVSFLKAGLVYADMLTTVSGRYAEEIQTSAFGCGMEDVLSRRRKELHGILNGIDIADADPAVDRNLAANYDLHSIENKAVCKRAIQKELQLKTESKAPLFGFISRLAEQKGIDLLVPLLERIAKAGWQLVSLGTGEERYHQLFRNASKEYPSQISLNVLFDEKLAKQIYAGIDIFLMPSQFEPCGLGQLIAFRYGTVPLVREVGGLVDTVKEYDTGTKTGNGFLFLDYTAEKLYQTMTRAVSVYRDSNQWRQIVRNGMACDFSWTMSARQYIDVYQQVERKESVT